MQATQPITPFRQIRQHGRRFCSGAQDGATYTGVTALGVPACGPTPEVTQTNIDVGPTGAGGPIEDFQCVEFAERYLWVTQGYAPINGTNGDQVVAHYAAAHSLPVVVNGSGQLPQVGAVMSFADSSAFNDSNGDGGHVAIVTKVTASSVTVVGENQNGSGPYTDGSAIMTVTANDHIHDFNPSLPDIEWMNPAKSGNTGTSQSVQTVVTSDGHVQVFYDAAGALEENWYSPATGAVGGWSGVGGLQVEGAPALVPRAGQSVIDAFIRSTAGQIYETWYNWGNGQWGGWIPIAGGSFTSDPQAVATSDGHDQIFADANGTLAENWFSPATGAVGGWSGVGGLQVEGAPALVRGRASR